MKTKQNKMKKQNVLIYGLISMLFLITACQKELDNDIHDLNPIADCYLKDGRLVFQDDETFKEHLEWIYSNQANPDIIKNKYNTLGLTSLMVVYDNGMDLVDDENVFQQYVTKHPTAFHKVNFDSSIIYELPTASILAYIVNENGIYQVGDKIFRTTFDYFLELSTNNISKLDELLLPISQINDSYIKVKTSGADNGLKSGGNYGQYGEYSYRTAYMEPDLRIVARLKTWGADGATFFEARTTAQKKGIFGIWFKKIISEVHLSWSQGQVKFYSWDESVILSAGDYSEESASDIKKTVTFVFYPIDLSQSSCIASHMGIHGKTTAKIDDNQIFE